MIRSNWFLALLGIVLGIATTAGVILSQGSKLAEDRTAGSELPSPRNAPRDWVFWTEELNKLAGDLKAERQALEERAKDLERVEQRLAVEREELRKVRAELDGMRREVTESIPKIEASERQNVKTLAKTYSTMKAKDAVAVMRELDDSSLVKILGSMKAEVVGSIFQEMALAKDADGTLAVRAARLSEQLRLVQSADNAPAKP